LHGLKKLKPQYFKDFIKFDILLVENKLFVGMQIHSHTNGLLGGSHKTREKFMQQIDLFHSICANIYANSTVYEEGKFELKLAQWELYDYCLWDNTFGNNSKSIMRWFDEWAYQANYVE